MVNDAVGSGRSVDLTEDDDEDEIFFARHSVFAPDVNRRVRVRRTKHGSAMKRGGSVAYRAKPRGRRVS